MGRTITWSNGSGSVLTTLATSHTHPAQRRSDLPSLGIIAIPDEDLIYLICRKFTNHGNFTVHNYLINLKYYEVGQ